MSLIPLFPLQLVLFPGDKLPLHIFEPRYKDMVKECLELNLPFGIVSFIDKQVSKVGTFASIVRVETEYDDGRLDIVTRGSDRFMTRSYSHSRTFLQGSVTSFNDEQQLSPQDADLLAQVLSQFEELAELAKLRFENPALANPKNAFGFGHIIGFDLAQKQNLLEIKSETERLQYVLEHIKRSIPRLKGFQDTRDLIKSNGHFREFPPLDFNI
ncbi:MAG: LON peptidase substrate-binding domain-containing protein [Candidatus Cyclonatronum sp.]|uniref:LON peptidase substrate-binding domain-containing protein n=1 Tax=Cyclonatronum sp. TaxID=3024185 RepID=UPI0025C50EFD|nr:LON peptidase substrate-binding domain-containing protein [Cyclonatronum sp.]MCC5935337.1 LON peptidase substrate-binding domain-containing protein [Balneolales bacterium]MCH8487970.1 LON peptidase substrate-binding domain-containing protein [Cyclonatronum sp.]